MVNGNSIADEREVNGPDGVSDVEVGYRQPGITAVEMCQFPGDRIESDLSGNPYVRDTLCLDEMFLGFSP